MLLTHVMLGKRSCTICSPERCHQALHLRVGIAQRCLMERAAASVSIHCESIRGEGLHMNPTHITLFRLTLAYTGASLVVSSGWTCGTPHRHRFFHMQKTRTHDGLVYSHRERLTLTALGAGADICTRAPGNARLVASGLNAWASQTCEGTKVTPFLLMPIYRMSMRINA